MAQSMFMIFFQIVTAITILSPCSTDVPVKNVSGSQLKVIYLDHEELEKPSVNGNEISVEKYHFLGDLGVIEVVQSETEAHLKNTIRIHVNVTFNQKDAHEEQGLVLFDGDAREGMDGGPVINSNIIHDPRVKINVKEGDYIKLTVTFTMDPAPSDSSEMGVAKTKIYYKTSS